MAELPVVSPDCRFSFLPCLTAGERRNSRRVEKLFAPGQSGRLVHRAV